jgi:hypothetical protein
VTEDHYVRSLLDAYRTLPDTTGRVRPADRQLARKLFRHRISLDLVRAAFRVALSRRRARPANEPTLPTIRSLHYFLPVIEEARSLPQDYLDYIAGRSGDSADHPQDGCDLR